MCLALFKLIFCQPCLDRTVRTSEKFDDQEYETISLFPLDEELIEMMHDIENYQCILLAPIFVHQRENYRLRVND